MHSPLGDCTTPQINLEPVCQTRALLGHVNSCRCGAKWHTWTAMSLLLSCVPQATANRSQDAQYYANQQALLQKQLADLTLRAQKLGAESLEASEGLRKKRLKLHQEVEVGWNTKVYVLPFTSIPHYVCMYQPKSLPFCLCVHASLVELKQSSPACFLQMRLDPTRPGFQFPTGCKKGFVHCECQNFLAVLDLQVRWSCTRCCLSMSCN